jgi:hypothetical protein
MKNFVKALDRNGPAFSFLCEKFPRLSTEICEHFRDPQFDLVLSDDEKAAWNSSRHVATGFLGDVKTVKFPKLVEDLITFYDSWAAT